VLSSGCTGTGTGSLAHRARPRPAPAAPAPLPELGRDVYFCLLTQRVTQKSRAIFYMAFALALALEAPRQRPWRPTHEVCDVPPSPLLPYSYG